MLIVTLKFMWQQKLSSMVLHEKRRHTIRKRLVCREPGYTATTNQVCSLTLPVRVNTHAHNKRSVCYPPSTFNVQFVTHPWALLHSLTSTTLDAERVFLSTGSAPGVVSSSTSNSSPISSSSSSWSSSRPPSSLRVLMGHPRYGRACGAVLGRTRRGASRIDGRCASRTLLLGDAYVPSRCCLQEVGVLVSLGRRRPALGSPGCNTSVPQSLPPAVRLSL